MTPAPTDPDTTIADIHRIRERIAEKFNFDIAAIVDDARRRQEASGWPIWRGSEPAAEADRGECELS